MNETFMLQMVVAIAAGIAFGVPIAAFIVTLARMLLAGVFFLLSLICGGIVWAITGAIALTNHLKVRYGSQK